MEPVVGEMSIDEVHARLQQSVNAMASPLFGTFSDQMEAYESVREFAPPGFLKELRNLLPRHYCEYTDDLKKSGVVDMTQMIGTELERLEKQKELDASSEWTPNKNKMRRNKKLEQKKLNLQMSEAQHNPDGTAAGKNLAPRTALMFSHISSDPRDLMDPDLHSFQPDIKSRADVCGTVIDQRSLAEIGDHDIYIHTASLNGAIIAIYIMEKGWNKERQQNNVCHACGKFPAPWRCLRCKGGAFCTNLCMQRAARREHTPEICDKLFSAKAAVLLHDSLDQQLESSTEQMQPEEVK